MGKVKDPSLEDSLGALKKQCLTMTPDYNYAVKVNELKEKLNKNRQKRTLPTPKPLVNNPQKTSNARSSPRLQEEQQRKMENSIHLLSEEVKNISAELDTYFDSLNEIMDMLKLLYGKFDEMNQKLLSPPSVSYADVARTIPADAPVLNASERRLDKLEYQNSENERLNRILQVTITHPALEMNSQNIFSAATHFMENIMLMEWWQIDANMYVQATRRPKTILITFSDPRFKNLLFKARNKLPQQQFPIYINDHLTNYNYKILKLAKEERKRNNENLNCLFETVYSYNGRVFIKKNRSDPTAEAILIKSPESLHEIVNKLSDAMNQ